MIDRDRIIMANARRLIKRRKAMSNRELYSELFGTGSTTANARCIALGLNPDSNVSTTHGEVKP